MYVDVECLMHILKPKCNVYVDFDFLEVPEMICMPMFKF